MSAGDYALAVVAFLLLFMWQTPPWLVVLLCAIGGAALSAI
jgi:chromate transporter